MAQVSRTLTHDASPDEMWSRIGDFHQLDSWHPALASCTPRDGGNGRELTLADGGTILETRIDEGPRSYSYRIDEGPLPVRGYESTLAVSDGENGGCEVEWAAEFEADGVPEDEAITVIEHIFDTGLGNL